MSTRALAAVLALVGHACGYTVVQAGPPFGAERVAVVPFVEDEALGVAADLATELAQRLAGSGVALTTDRAGADAVLSGRIEPLGVGAAPVSSPSVPMTLFHLTLVANVTLTRGKAELWRARVVASDDYQALDPGSYAQLSGADLGSESRRREALRRASRSLARAIAEQLALASATTLTPAIAPPRPTPTPASPVPKATTPPPAGSTASPGSAPASPATGVPAVPATPPGATAPSPPG